jgi:hypothetical protein
VLAAYRELQQIQREAAAVAELPVAQLTALTANINRDTTKGQPFGTEQFCFYRSTTREESITAEVAAVALSLRREERCPALILAIWPQILAAATKEAGLPPLRAMHSDDDAVWVLAPRLEGDGIRGGLVAVRGQISGSVELRELDRPLLTHRLRLPKRAGFGWLESDLLLLAEN